MAAPKYLHLSLCLSSALLALSPNAAQSCATLSLDSRASLANEQVIIVWDEAKKTEHFVRRMEFNLGASESKNQSIGFLVPSPSVPQIAEVSDAAFGIVQGWMKPKVEVREEVAYYYHFWNQRGSHTFSAASSPLSMEGTASNSASGNSVQVVSQQKVGALDATILKGDARGVVRWLARNGYPSRPEFERWLAPYAARGWAITAFKFAPRRGAGTIETTTVRLSFRTQTPFYPYREPEKKSNAPSPTRQMALYVLAPRRVQGIVDEPKKNTQKWHASTEWAAPVPDASALAGDLKLSKSTFGPQMQMTAFVDTPVARQDGDLRFPASDDQSPIVPPPIITKKYLSVYVPLDLLAVAALAGGMLVARRRKND